MESLIFTENQMIELLETCKLNQISIKICDLTFRMTRDCNLGSIKQSKFLILIKSSDGNIFGGYYDLSRFNDGSKFDNIFLFNFQNNKPILKIKFDFLPNHTLNTSIVPRVVVRRTPFKKPLTSSQQYLT